MIRWRARLRRRRPKAACDRLSGRGSCRGGARAGSPRWHRGRAMDRAWRRGSSPWKRPLGAGVAGVTRLARPVPGRSAHRRVRGPALKPRTEIAARTRLPGSAATLCRSPPGLVAPAVELIASACTHGTSDFNVFEHTERIFRQHRQRAIQRDQVGGDGSCGRCP